MDFRNHERAVTIPMDAAVHQGTLAVPAAATGLVLFAHGSGSGRLSPRNNYVARILRENGVATLLFDLLTEAEDRIYENRFDIDLLTHRLLLATQWAGQQPATRALALGYFGASTGAAAALRAAAALGPGIGAVVSRGGRPDLALDDLPRVQAPTLLIVGGNDAAVIELNRAAYRELCGEKELKIIPGATHLFEEPGTLEQVAAAAADWFRRHLNGKGAASWN
ncbi:DeoR family transcriptional regulator [Sulfuricaulis limicola]|uniref:DeoR family transcriptional regulator n=1 Tax=Sulfuricaulis limicola TaxID=1620215 RepID=A0A1B4XE58_9GAMM|nr:dienelactone hydrolase family protein [Sulfuricaulis limicola]BAV33078.1 DeoR family transcriptional regulator [Sulfuricaulis limicola]